MAEKLFEGEHADLHLDDEERSKDAENAADIVADSTACMDDDYRVYFDTEDEIGGAKIAVAVLGLVFGAAMCVGAILLGRKLASKE